MRKFLCLTALLTALNIMPVQAETKTVILGGETIAVTVNYNGVYVNGMYDFDLHGENISAAKLGTVQIGDRIIESNGKKISSIEDLFSNLNHLQQEKTLVPVKVIRNGEETSANLLICYLSDEKVFKTGLYVKDKIKGVGTMTFYDPSTMTFGALGHEIAESGLQQPADVSMGDVFLATVVSIRRSTAGSPGEKISKTDSLVPIGRVSKNTIFGLYGNVLTLPTKPRNVPVATRDQIQLGEAEIYTVLQGENPELFKIRITEIQTQENQAVKGISFEVTDPKLLSQSGGIIQGMSGSPILQNGKIIGAVTHMVTSHPESGYGLFIEWMLEESGSV